MLGALIGDIVGSVYEWHNHKSKDFPLFQPDCRMTDDSVMTAAVASAVLMGTEDLAQFQANVVAEMRRLGRQHPRLGYGPRFEAWLANPDPQPYGSLGNGSAMRVSPVAWAAESLSQCLALAKASAEVTHNHPDGIAGACVVAGAVYLARVGESKAAIADHVTRYYPLDFTLDEIREDYAFDVTCAGSVPQAMEAFLEAESFEDALRGAVSIGGVNVKDMDPGQLMNTVSFVLQNSHLIKASILDNVRLGRPDASETQVMAALEQAQCMDIIEKFPQGVHTVIGSQGVYLSGGEMQRIAIARAILKDAPVLILDEATAFADPDNERKVQAALTRLAQGRTVLMIAHRLSTVTGADKIFVLEEGRLVQQGSFVQLSQSPGLFGRMWNEYQQSVAWNVAKEA